MTELVSQRKPNIDAPRWDQSVYWNRAKHFFVVTNPLNVFATSDQLEKAREVVRSYREGVFDPSFTVDELWHAKSLYDSAYHPDTGEKQIIVGRMSAQVPCNMLITGCMLTFYKSKPEVIFWQWFNQSFNAMVNYTNRSGDAPISIAQLGTSYVCATGGALVTALGLNSLVSRMPSLIGRFVPFAAVAAANCVNLPMMRSKELKDGITLVDAKGEKVGQSKIAAKVAIAKVVTSRIVMAMPGMLLPPLLMNYLEKKPGYMRHARYVSGPLQVAVCGVFLVFMTPMCCALFPQISSIPVSRLESDVQDGIRKKLGDVDSVFYNKGL